MTGEGVVHAAAIPGGGGALCAVKIASSATIEREEAVLSRLSSCTGFARVLGSGPYDASGGAGRKGRYAAGGGSMKERTKRDTSSVGGSVCGSADSSADGADSGGQRYLAMTMCGPSLEDLLTLCGRKLSPHLVARLATQMIALLRDLHETAGFISRDVKPRNFLVRSCSGPAAEELCFVDFGSAERIVFRGGGVADGDSALVGTLRYCSINAHQGGAPTPADDLEGLAYVLIYLCRGALPWQKRKGGTEALRQREARRSSAEHLIATKALRCTATARMLIVAQCSAIP